MTEVLVQNLRKCGLDIKMGYQRELYQIFQQSGPFSKPFFKKLQQACSNFKQHVTILLQSLTETEKELSDGNLLFVLKEFSNYLFNKRYLDVEQIKTLINEIIFLPSALSQSIIQNYGLQEQFSKDFNYFKDQIRKRIGALKPDQKQKLNSQTIQAVFGQLQQPKNSRLINLEYSKMQTPDDLRVICLRNRIVLKESQLSTLFEVIRQQGLLSQHLQIQLKKSTFPAFHEKLRHLVNKLLSQPVVPQDQNRQSTLSNGSLVLTKVYKVQEKSSSQIPSSFDSLVQLYGNSGQHPSSQRYVQIENFQSNKFSLFEQNRTSRSQTHIRRESIQIVRQSQPRINPFKPTKITVQKGFKVISILLIYLGLSPCKSMRLKESQGIQIWQTLEYNKKEFDKCYILYSNFKIKIQTQYTLSFDNKTVTLKSNDLKINQGYSLFIYNAEEPKMREQNIDILQLQNYSLFTGIKFIIKQIRPKKSAEEEAIFCFLKLFYDNYHFQLPEKLSIKTLQNIYISRTVPIEHTKYFIYFFKQVFKKNALTYFFKHRIYKDLKFKREFQFNAPENYCYLVNTEHFYSLTQLITIIENEPQSQLICELVRRNFESQLKQNIYITLYIVICEAPIHISLTLQSQIKQVCLRNPLITRSEYYNLMTRFTRKVLNETSNLQQKHQAIVKYFDDLVIFCKAKDAFNKDREIETTVQVIQPFVQSVSKNSRITFSTKLKELFIASNHELDPSSFLQTTGQYFPQADITKYVLWLSRKPITAFDRLETDRLAKSRFWAKQLQELIQLLLESNLSKFEVSRLVEIIKLILKTHRPRIEDMEFIVLGWLDRCIQMETKPEDANFLRQIFRVLLSAVQFMSSVNPPSLMLLNGQKRLRKYLEKTAGVELFQKEILIRLDSELTSKQCSVVKIIQHVYRTQELNTRLARQNLNSQQELKQLWKRVALEPND